MTDSELAIVAFAALVLWLVHDEAPEIQKGKKPSAEGTSVGGQMLTQPSGKTGADVDGCCCTK